MLEMRNISINYGAKMAVEDVSLQVGEREIVGIVGESGSGKTTLIRSIIGLLGRQGEIVGGKIMFQGRELSQFSEAEMRKVRGGDIGMLFQHPELSMNPIWKIKRLIYESMRVRGAVSRQEAEKKGLELLFKLSLNDAERVMNAYPFELSGGMCQRVAMALAMINEPKLILADEPTSALDVTVQRQVMETMTAMREELGTSILIVSHNIGVIAGIADHVGVMFRGRMVEWGRSAEVLTAPEHEYTKALLRAVPRLNRDFTRA